MISEDKLIDLNLKKIDLKIEKDKDLLKFSISFLIAVLSFLFTTNLVKKYYYDSLLAWIGVIADLSLPWNVILIILTVFGIPVLLGWIVFMFMTFLVKSKTKLYEDKINEVNKLITKFSKKK